jgi:predicted nucleic acid-binding Zn ribbon protein
MKTSRRSKGVLGFFSLGAVIEEAIKGLGLGDAVAKGAAMHFWPEVVGETVARVTSPETVRGNTLVVNVADSAWLQNLTQPSASPS